MGLFSKSNSTTSTTNEFFDQRQVNDAGGGVVATNGAVVSVTDHGTVNAAVELAKQAQERAASVNVAALDKVFQLGTSSTAQAYENSTAAIGAVMTAYETSSGKVSEKSMIPAALIAAGLVGSVLIFRRSAK